MEKVNRSVQPTGCRPEHQNPHPAKTRARCPRKRGATKGNVETGDIGVVARPAGVQSTANGRRGMKMRHRIALAAVPALVMFAIALGTSAQRSRGKVQSMQATVDSGVAHPATAAITGPASVTCMNATSEAQNSKPVPSCHVVAPGFTGNLNKGQTASITGAGNATLTCNGQGPMLRCTARVDTPPVSQ